MGRFEKHIGKGITIKIGDDEFQILPIGTENIPDFFLAMKAFSGAKEDGGTEDMLKNINTEGLEAVVRLINNTLEVSFPDEPEQDRKKFGMKYMNLLLPKIMELNSADKPNTKEVGALKRAESIKRMKEQQQQNQKWKVVKLKTIA